MIGPSHASSPAARAFLLLVFLVYITCALCFETSWLSPLQWRPWRAALITATSLQPLRHSNSQLGTETGIRGFVWQDEVIDLVPNFVCAPLLFGLIPRVVHWVFVFAGQLASISLLLITLGWRHHEVCRAAATTVAHYVRWKLRFCFQSSLSSKNSFT